MESTRGFFTLIHHTGPLLEWSDDIRERHACIDRDKPEHERATRHRCIVRVPEGRLPTLYAASQAYLAILDGILADPTTLSLVRELVPNCPWDGHAIIFPTKGA